MSKQGIKRISAYDFEQMMKNNGTLRVSDKLMNTIEGNTHFCLYFSCTPFFVNVI